jgi:RimJ/RimL family protein N-acetyltransferase
MAGPDGATGPVDEGRLTFRPLDHADLPVLAGWIAAEHVARWWGEPADLASVEAKYGPRIGGQGVAEELVIELDGRPIGLIQRYRHRDHPGWDAAIAIPDAAGIDYLIGLPDLVGIGLGPAVIRAFVPTVFEAYPDAEVVVAAPQQANVASWRALEKAGFTRVRSGWLESDDPSDAGESHVYVRRRSDPADA